MAGGAVGAGWGLDGRDCCSLVCSRFGSPVSGVARVVRWRAPKLGIVFLAKPGELVQPDDDRLLFVSERRLGFGTHGASNIAQRKRSCCFDVATRGAGGAASGPPPTRGAAPSPPAAPIDTRPITAENATGRPVLVASALWPQYACKEFGGAGWAATVLRCSKHTAIVRFTIASTRDGRPYEDERVPLDRLRPLPSQQSAA